MTIVFKLLVKRKDTPSVQIENLYDDYMAYFEVHSRAVLSCLARSVLRSCAISGTNGSSGLGSVKREQMDNRTLEIVRAGLH